jgi:actin-related protein
LSGGSTLFEGFAGFFLYLACTIFLFLERFIFQMRLLLNADFPLKLKVPKSRQVFIIDFFFNKFFFKCSSWIGGSIFCSQEMMNSLWITREMYEEEGAECVFFK